MDNFRLLELAGVEYLTEKMDPDQEFAIATIDRRGIAEIVNSAIEEKRLNIPHFGADDPRLTPKFCNEFGAHMRDWHEGFQDTWMHGNDVVEQAADFISEVGMTYLRTVPAKPKKKPATSDTK